MYESNTQCVGERERGGGGERGGERERGREGERERERKRGGREGERPVSGEELVEVVSPESPGLHQTVVELDCCTE